MTAEPIQTPAYVHDNLLVERFWAKVEKGPDCWPWKACLRNGYGMINAPEKYAHRFSYELNNGPIPKGKYVLHRCDNRACVRPEHLILGTQKENLIDMMRKGRRIRKLTVDQVKEIRQLYDPPRITTRMLAGQFQVSR